MSISIVLFDVRGKNAEIRINGERVYTENFKQDFGDIVGITYVFDGAGTIDFVQLSDPSGKAVFADDFSRFP